MNFFFKCFHCIVTVIAKKEKKKTEMLTSRRMIAIIVKVKSVLRGREGLMYAFLGCSELSTLQDQCP